MGDRVDFLPKDYVEQRSRQRTNTIYIGLFVVVMIGVAGGFLVTEQRQRRIDKQEAAINAKAATFAESLRQFEALEAAKKQMVDKAAISAGLIEPMGQSLLLALLTNDLPDGVALTKYKLKTKELKDKNAKKKSKSKKSGKKSSKKKKKSGGDDSAKLTKLKTDIEFFGLAETDRQVAAYIANLQASPLLTDLNLQHSKEFHDRKTGSYMRNFKLTASLPGNTRATESDVEAIRFRQLSPADGDLSVLGWLFGGK